MNLAQIQWRYVGTLKTTNRRLNATAFGLRSPLLKVVARSDKAKPTWNSAGYLYQQYGNSIITSRLVLLGTHYLPLSTALDTYNVRFKANYWHTAITLKIYEPTNLEILAETIEKLNLLKL